MASFLYFSQAPSTTLLQEFSRKNTTSGDPRQRDSTKTQQTNSVRVALSYNQSDNRVKALVSASEARTTNPFFFVALCPIPITARYLLSIYCLVEVKTIDLTLAFLSFLD